MRTDKDDSWPRLSGGAITWSGLVVDEVGNELFSVAPDRVLATASIGKLLLLVEVAEQLAAGDLDPSEPLTRAPADRVADSGLWQTLDTDALPLRDVAALVGSVSDNLATNVLLRRVGLAAVADRALRLELERTALLDQVRDVRTVDDPPCLSRGNARELVRLMQMIGQAESISSVAAEQVAHWLRFNADLSMVASSWQLDPLAHHQPDNGLELMNKTGTNLGVRADVGRIRLQTADQGRWVTYAVLANWSPERGHERGEALTAMAQIGERIGADLYGQPTQP